MTVTSLPCRDADRAFRRGGHRVSNGVMKATSRLLLSPLGAHVLLALSLLALSLLALSLLAGCGDYNPEDLVFRGAIPRAEHVMLAPPGVDPETARAASANELSQALSACEGGEGERDLRCVAQGIANSLNGLSIGVLSNVDLVVQRPPSAREPGRRVWGPWSNAREGHDYRFEMERVAPGEFSFCVHARPIAQSERPRRTLTCDDEVDESGFIRVVTGVLSPGESEGEEAQTGAGSLVISLDAVGALRDQDIGGTLTIVFDHTGAEHDITVSLDAIRAPRFPRDATYRYHRASDGAGTFRFRAEGERHRGAAPEPQLLEQLDITAQWRQDRAGRADAVYSGGNLAPLELHATQCWDEELCEVYSDEPSQGSEGDLGACAFEQPLGD